ncbi:MAG: phosphatase [Bacteroidetes bacterium]|nr:phosphatase [Bacteroidota bacterium]
MRTAIIDIGTNTFNLMIVELSRTQGYKIIYRQKLPSKLGKGGINQDTITPAAFKRGLHALKFHKDTIGKFGASGIYAYATSAVRCADNGCEFVDCVRRELGIEIRVISGEEEAELVCYGIRQAVPLTDERVLMLDIGGGSNEFIIADKDDIFWKQSYQLGIARVIDLFRPCEPILIAEKEAIEDYFDIKLRTLYEAVGSYPVDTLIGSSGSFATLADIIYLKKHGPGEMQIEPYHYIDMDDYIALHDYLLTTTLADRKKIHGADQTRVEMLVIASIFIHHVIRRLNIKKMLQSRYALKEGIIAQIMDHRYEVKR